MPPHDGVWKGIGMGFMLAKIAVLVRHLPSAYLNKTVRCPVIAVSQYVDISRHMDDTRVIDALSALAQRTRLEVFRALVASEPEGLAAGDLARRLGAPHNTMSTHLAVLSRVGLITSERQSRNIIYRADLTVFRDVVLHLLKDCCAGRPEICAPLIADLIPCCDSSGGCHG